MKFYIAAFTWALLLVFGAGLSAQESRPARGQDEKERGRGFIERWDTDHDGKVSREEFKGRPEMFERMDLNKDGHITPEELRPARQQESTRPPEKAMGAGRQGGDARGLANILFLNPWVEALDTSADGKISKTEWTAGFDKLDRNHDGQIMVDEYPRPQPPSAERLIKLFDRNGDGRLSVEELPPNLKERLKDLDKDKDGFLSEKELETWLKSVAPEAARQGQRSQGGEGERRRDNAQARVDELFSKNDKNSDGLLSRDEAPPRLRERFNEIDLNNDGFLSKEEVKKALNDPGATVREEAAQYLKVNDRDGDGKLNRDEFPGDKALFDSIDVNKDGFLTLEEITSARLGAKRK